MSGIQITLRYCLVFGLLLGCTEQRLITSTSNLSTDQQLQDSPGVTTISSQELPNEVLTLL